MAAKEDRTNMKHFLRWANRRMGHTPLAALMRRGAGQRCVVVPCPTQNLTFKRSPRAPKRWT